MHITFDNLKEYYSNVIAIHQSKALKPQLVGNTILGNSITVNGRLIIITRSSIKVEECFQKELLKKDTVALV